MVGEVRAIKPYDGLIAVQTAVNEFSVLKLLDDYDVRVGDLISGDLFSPGDGQVRNETQAQTMDVDVRESRCDTRRLVTLM